MTHTAGAASAAEGDRFANAAREAVRAWDHAAACASKAVAGTYLRTDAIAELDRCAAAAARRMEELVLCWAELVEGIAPSYIPAPQPSPEVTARVPPAVAHRPLTLETTGFRAIGYGAAYFLPAAAVSFDLQKNVLPVGVDEFTVKVDCKGLPTPAHRITIIYEGEITSTQTGALVTDPIRFVKPAWS